MTKELIVTLYQTAVEYGDPVEQIKSLAKANSTSANEIKKILLEAGEELPKGMKAAIVNEDFENAVQDMVKESKEKYIKGGCLQDQTGSCTGCEDADICFGYVKEKKTPEVVAREKLPLPQVIGKCLEKELDNIDANIRSHLDEIQQLEKEYKAIASFLMSN